jgi:hypothetical protein
MIRSLICSVNALEQRAVRLQNSCDVIEIVGNGELESVVCDFLTSVEQESYYLFLPSRVGVVEQPESRVRDVGNRLRLEWPPSLDAQAGSAVSSDSTTGTLPSAAARNKSEVGRLSRRA